MSAVAEFLKDKTVLIMGFGREGKSTYNYIRKYLPTKSLAISDKNQIADENVKADPLVELICGDNYTDVINDYEVVIKSPGITVRDLEIHDDVMVTCQLDLFMKFAPCRKIGITGTKGKTTTSTLTHCVLKSAGINTCLIGNIGIPVFEVLDSCEGMTAVIEMSSHQLEFTRTSPNIAVLTNIYEEHLDHYNGFEGYYNAKLNIVRNQGENDFFIHNKEQNLGDFIDVSTIKSHMISVGMDDAHDDAFLQSLVGLNPHLKGRHNNQDVFFVTQIARILGISDDDIRRGIASFEGIPHRLEYVGKYAQIEFYNDCIATVPTAVMFGVEALEKVDTLIIGGMDRGLDYTKFEKNLVESKIENIICLPETGHNIADAILNRCDKNIVKVHDMVEAVDDAFKFTKPGTVCLISPAASSYNYYKNFEEKGDHFKKLVREHGDKN